MHRFRGEMELLVLVILFRECWLLRDYDVNIIFTQCLNTTSLLHDVLSRHSRKVCLIITKYYSYDLKRSKHLSYLRRNLENFILERSELMKLACRTSVNVGPPSLIRIPEYQSWYSVSKKDWNMILEKNLFPADRNICFQFELRLTALHYTLCITREQFEDI